MDNIPDNLTIDQLKSAITQLQKGGLDNTKVQQFVNQYTQGTDGGYIRKGAQKAPQSTTTEQTQSSMPSFGQRVAADIKQRGENVVGAIKGTSQESQGEGAVVRGLQATGQAFGAIGDVVKEALTVSPEKKAAMQEKTKSTIPGKAFNAIKESQFGKNVAGNLGIANEKLGDALLKFTETHPEEGKKLESFLKGASASGEIAGTIAGADVASLGLNKVPVLGAEATPTAVKAAVGDLGNSTINTAKNVAQGTKDLTGAISEKAQPLVNATKSKLASRQVNKTLDLVKATEDTMTKSERLQALGETGRVTTTKLGGKEFLPTDTEKRASEILAGKLKSNPVKNVPIIKKEIATLGKDAEQYLAKNPIKISAQEQADMFSKFKKDAEKSFTKPELKAYDEQMKLFLKQIPGRGGYNTSTFYKGLKDFEANVADHLPRGRDALIDPTGIASAKLRAASDIRKIVRDAIGDRHGEFKSKMFDLASLYDVKSTMITKAEQLGGNAISRFTKKNPIAATIIGTAVAGEAGKKLLTGEF